MSCKKCGSILSKDSNFCPSCGTPISSDANFLLVTTPTVPGYKIKQVLGLVTGLTPRTRGVLGQFHAGIESVFGGEVTAFTSEIEKARWEAISRTKATAIRMGANAIIGLDVETTGIGQSGIILFSATGTAVILEKE